MLQVFLTCCMIIEVTLFMFAAYEIEQLAIFISVVLCTFKLLLNVNNFVSKIQLMKVINEAY